MRPRRSPAIGRRLAEAIGRTPVFICQVHGTSVVRLTPADAVPGAPIHTADASVTTDPDIACAIQVADCLPVLFAAPEGRGVGAAHAGWRGLAAGVLEATIDTLCEAARVRAWRTAGLDRCRDRTDAFSGRRRCGRGVRRRGKHGVVSRRTPRKRTVARRHIDRRVSCPRRTASGSRTCHCWHATACGRRCRSITGGTWCTVSEPSRFFSFRRDRVTGRMAAVIWLDVRR